MTAVVTVDGPKLVALAEDIATRAHEGKLDKGGAPYIDHPRWVASNMGSHWGKAVAWLHDVLEDSDWTPEALIEAGVPKGVVDFVIILTRVGGETYEDYISRCLTTLMTARVKGFDLLHNTDPARKISEEDRARLGPRYHAALVRVLARISASAGM